MKATGRLLVISLSTALSFGVLMPIASSDAEAATARTYLPDSPYELRRRTQAAGGAAMGRTRLPSPQTIYQDAPVLQQSPSGLVTDAPTTIEAPLPLEVAPLYPQRAVSAPVQIDPISADEFAAPPPPEAFSPLGDGTPAAGIDPIPMPAPPAALEPTPLPPQPVEVQRTVSKEKPRSLWDYLSSDSENETIVYQQQPSATSTDSALGVALPPPPPPLGYQGESLASNPEPIALTAPVAPMAETDTPMVNLDISADPSAQMPEPIRSPHNALSAESRNMISEIPQELTPKAQPVKKVKVSRIDPDIANILQAGENSGFSTESGSVGVKVKRPSFDVNYELEKAYHAVVGGNIEEAVGIYKEALSIAPRNRTGLFGLATTYHRIGSLDNARALYARLLEIEPDHREGLNNFLALVAEESPEDALPELQVLANKHPGFSPILAQLGLLYHQLGDRSQARQHMLSAVRISPENMTYRYNLAIMLDEQGAYAEAANLYRYLIGVSERGVEIPTSPEALQARLTYILSQIS